jgi:hypothetical protein
MVEHLAESLVLHMRHEAVLPMPLACACSQRLRTPQICHLFSRFICPEDLNVSRPSPQESDVTLSRVSAAKTSHAHDVESATRFHCHILIPDKRPQFVYKTTGPYILETSGSHLCKRENI